MPTQPQWTHTGDVYGTVHGFVARQKPEDPRTKKSLADELKAKRAHYRKQWDEHDRANGGQGIAGLG